MAEIRVLDKHTAELIAAGVFVDRPASVAKDLPICRSRCRRCAAASSSCKS